MLPQEPIVYAAGDYALTFQWGNSISLDANQLVMQLFNSLLQDPLPFVSDIIPAYNSLTVVYNVVELRKNNASITAYDQIKTSVYERLKSQVNNISKYTLVKIPVCYHPSVAPDLAHMAAQTELTEAEIIQLHCQPIYKVYLIGFLPGFPYMASVNKAIQFPRKTTPRALVPAGSVGIAGEQTGIYPLNSPGGWQLIGKTPLILFDMRKEMPCLLQPGDTVQFYPIELAEFLSIQQQNSE